jgi:probable HAF family extracellular repeat protein
MGHASSCYSHWSIAGLLVALIGLGTPANAQAQRCSVTDLGTLGGATSKGYGINASGQVTGEAVTAGGVFHAFLYANRVMRDLNSMIDPAIAAYVILFSGKGINDDGWIVANGIDSRTGKTHAYLLSKH